MDKQLDYVIVGAGPAGLQTAYFLKKAGRSFVVLERASEVGDEEVRLRWDWNSLISDELSPLFREFSRRYFPPADDFIAYLKRFQSDHRLEVELNTHVAAISRSRADGFVVRAKDGRSWEAERVIVATGVAEENIPSFPGAE